MTLKKNLTGKPVLPLLMLALEAGTVAQCVKMAHEMATPGWECLIRVPAAPLSIHPTPH